MNKLVYSSQTQITKRWQNKSNSLLGLRLSPLKWTVGMNIASRIWWVQFRTRLSGESLLLSFVMHYSLNPLTASTYTVLYMSEKMVNQTNQNSLTRVLLMRTTSRRRCSRGTRNPLTSKRPNGGERRTGVHRSPGKNTSKHSRVNKYTCEVVVDSTGCSAVRGGWVAGYVS